nr:DUF4435 domain-containing protein [Aeromonas hydrophila]
MSSDFLSMLFSKSYISALSIVENGKDAPIQGYIFVENEMDAHFWSKMLPKNVMSSYSFSTGSGDGSVQSGVRGITRFFKNLDKANELSIFAIDADHYFFKKNIVPEYKEIVENDFIIHTYGYSKESLQNSVENLIDCLDNFKFFHNSDFDFSIFLTRLSNNLYEPFLRFAYTISKNVPPFSEDEFYKFITPNAQLPFDESEYSWGQFALEMDNLIKAIVVDDEHEFMTFIESTVSIGLNKDNVYLFINGHVLENNIINPIISEIKSLLIKKKLLG